ncbi:hypothetical protein JXA32_13400 [Candidatus Sumerlaeota bacterium]|nr:hypothetical protein [Candidatus Sumerlaeota bacterium]
MLYTRKARRGQGMTEYVIIVALIAIFCIGIFTLFGHQIQQTTASIINKLGGAQQIHSTVEDESKNVTTEMGEQNQKQQMATF